MRDLPERPLYTETEEQTWSLLFQRQVPRIEEMGCRDFLDGLNIAGFQAETIPSLRELSKRVYAETHWRLSRVDGLVPIRPFFELVAARQFPATDFIRRREDLDYTPAPDLFHDQFGHVPLLTQPAYAHFFQRFGEAGMNAGDVGVTALALLAFLGEGNTSDQGEYKEQVANGIKWLRGMQDPDTGLIGDKSTHEFLYNHALGTLALCEAYYATRSPRLKGPCQRAVHYIQRARNPYGAWRYTEPPNGTDDTSVTGWMVFALKAAEDAGLDVDEGAYDGAMAWLEEVTDPRTGRVGYNELGSRSSRITGVNDHYPSEKGEAMTAVGLLCRVFMGQTDPDEHPVLATHGDLMLRSLPAWDPDGFGNDMYYWYYGTYAMYQLGGAHWRRWEAAMKPAILDSRRTDGDRKGSWDPSGPWGFSGGRVYSTALMALSIEVYFRYSRLTGAR